MCVSGRGMVQAMCSDITADSARGWRTGLAASVHLHASRAHAQAGTGSVPAGA